MEHAQMYTFSQPCDNNTNGHTLFTHLGSLGQINTKERTAVTELGFCDGAMFS